MKCRVMVVGGGYSSKFLNYGRSALMDRRRDGNGPERSSRHDVSGSDVIALEIALNVHHVN